MKKLIVLLIASVSFTAAFSQQDNYRNHKGEGNATYTDRSAHEQNSQYARHNDDRDHKDGYNQSRYEDDQSYYHNNGTRQSEYGASQRDRRYDEYNRQQEINRINRECDEQVYRYKNDRSMSRYERNRMIHRVQIERSEKIKSFGGGALIGAVAGFVLGTLVSH
jgi:hypothetical protein